MSGNDGKTMPQIHLRVKQRVKNGEKNKGVATIPGLDNGGYIPYNSHIRLPIYPLNVAPSKVFGVAKNNCITAIFDDIAHAKHTLKSDFLIKQVLQRVRFH